MQYGGGCSRVSLLSNLCWVSVSASPESWSLTDCPRDAMQGWASPIPLALKVDYLRALLRVGFDVLDAGSFVSPKAVPQMADTAKVLSALPESQTKVLAIVANQRGAEDAIAHGRPEILGFPFSISETFQQRNTGAGMEEGWRRVASIREATLRSGKDLVVYLSMGFGNPYGDPWSADRVSEWTARLHRELGVDRIALSDTVGSASPDVLQSVFAAVVAECPGVKVGAHLHGRPERAEALMGAAWAGGCRSFDGALGGHGGCPMAADDLVGNLPTEKLMRSPEAWGGEPRKWNQEALQEAQALSSRVFNGH